MTEQVFEAYAKKYANTVFRVAFNILTNREDAEDALQEVLIRFYRSRDKLTDDEHVKAWLIRVAVNESKRILHRRVRSSATSLEEVGELWYTDDHESRELFQTVMQLDEKYRTPLYLFYFEGYSDAEIASLTGVNRSTVRTRLQRAREQLKGILEDQHG